MLRRSSLVSLRRSLLAAMGLGAGACGEVVTTPSGQGSAGSGGGATTLCAGATPVLDANGNDTGFARCPDGTTHRAKKIACDPTLGIEACTGTEPQIDCMSDADCTAKPGGRCASHTVVDFGGAHPACGCVYPCVSDSDCAADEVCVCYGVTKTLNPSSFCARAGCATGDDCPSGECGVASFFDGCGLQPALVCRTPEDACRFDSDCAAGESCALSDFTPTWECIAIGCDIGRPLLVDGKARTAPSARRDDWAAAGAAPRVDGLSAPEREALTQHWLAIAALEHASVASFARFTLELLALGAPADLVAESQQAGLDEIEHATLAYGIASAYAGRPLGPGPLDLKGVLIATTRREVIRGLIEEACVGETLGAAEALAAAEHATDPALRRFHACVAVDEQRHAELGWRALAWLLGGADEDDRRFAAGCFEAAIAAVKAPGALHRQVLREVIAPCAAALACSAKNDIRSVSPDRWRRECFNEHP